MEFISKFDKIPILVELRESSNFNLRMGPSKLDQEWFDTRQTLKKIFPSKYITFNEDHMGFKSLEEDPKEVIQKTYLRIKTFLQQLRN